MAFIMRKNKLVYFSLGIVFILGIWILFSNIIDNQIILPKVGDVFISLFNLFKQSNTYLIIGATVLRLLITLCISFIITIILVSLSVMSIKFASFIRPLIILLKTIPVASIIIILLIVVGHEYSPLYITGFVILPLMYEAMYVGISSIDKHIKDEVKLLSETNLEIIFKIYIPITVPFIITSILQAVGLGLKVMVMSEFIAQPRLSIGRAMLIEKQYLELGNVFSWTIIIIIIVILLEKLISYLKNRLEL
jgi:NitT/TauT family transport system permease protein